MKRGVYSLFVVVLVAFFGCTLGTAPGPGGSLTLPAAGSVLIGTTLQLTAGGSASSQTITWSSSGNAIATVTTSGLVTGVGNGVATITAAAGGQTATCSVTSSGYYYIGSVQTSASNPNLTLPFYIKDGAALTLLPTGAQTNGSAHQMTQIGTNIFIYGQIQNDTGNPTPVYWENGVLSVLSLPSGSFGIAYNSSQDSLGNVYIRGHVQSTSAGNPEIPGYWLNGAWTPLTMVLPDGTAPSGSSSWGLTVDQSNNVYCYGYLQDPVSNVPVPVY